MIYIVFFVCLSGFALKYIWKMTYTCENIKNNIDYIWKFSNYIKQIFLCISATDDANMNRHTLV